MKNTLATAQRRVSIECLMDGAPQSRLVARRVLLSRARRAHVRRRLVGIHWRVVLLRRCLLIGIHGLLELMLLRRLVLLRLPHLLSHLLPNHGRQRHALRLHLLRAHRVGLHRGLKG